METETSFGIRTIAFSVDKGFQLNGKTVELKGGCVHHDNGPLGAKAYDRAEERRIELLKASGYNAVRCSHNPPSPAFLAACDKLGMLVIDEAFDMWRNAKNPYDYSLYFDEWWQKDIESMVDQIAMDDDGNCLFSSALVCTLSAIICTLFALVYTHLHLSAQVSASICFSLFLSA